MLENVNKLTLHRTFGHLTLIVISMWAGVTNASAFEPLENISEVAERFALTLIESSGLSKIEAHAANIDSRLQLGKCDTALEAFSTSSSAKIGRSTVGVRCNGTKPWTLYVPVNITALAGAVFTRRALSRGDTLSTQNLEVRQLPLQQLPNNYIGEIAQLQGMELSRDLSASAILTRSALKPKQIVKQGQEVSIMAEGLGVRVRMSGIALRNGALGDLIPIRNSSSGRVVQATISSNSTVLIKM